MIGGCKNAKYQSRMGRENCPNWEAGLQREGTSRGPGVLRFRMRSPKGGRQIQWRSKGQASFPESVGISILVEGGSWQEHEVDINEKDGVVHFRLLCHSKQSVEIDWIEISWQSDDETKSQRWDFRFEK